MKEILILSGKGGAGKTSICACFAKLAENSILTDCDVDASNLPLVLNPQASNKQKFFAGLLPKVDNSQCIGCGRCQKLCRFEAIKMLDNKAVILDGCEGCGVCADNCPTSAIELEPRHCGYWMRSQTPYGPMFHAELLAGAENSGKLIAELRNAAKQEATESRCQYLISDGPPGIGCPVISASTGVDYAVIVTEPTVSGIHDMQRLAKLLYQFGIKMFAIINKCDLNKDESNKTIAWCNEHNIQVLGSIPFDAQFSQAIKDGKTVLDYPESKVAEIVTDIWKKLTINLGDEK